MMMTYIPWNDIEDKESDGVQKIRDYLDKLWRGKDSAGIWHSFEEYNIKVVPRVYLRFPQATDGSTQFGLAGDHWPSDMTAGDFTSAQFDARLRRLIQRLALVFENDPRVAYIQMGIFGTWGEQHGTAQPANLEKYFSENFHKKQVQVRYFDKGQWINPGVFGQYNDSVGDLRTASNWATYAIGGESSFDYTGTDIYGTSTEQTYLNPANRFDSINMIRDTHAIYLTWIGEYPYGTDSHSGRDLYLQNKAAFDDGAAAVAKQFGYRYVLSDFSYPSQIQPGKPFDVSFTVTNTGSAPMYYPWPVQVSLRDPDNDKIVWSDVFADTDIREWQPGDTYTAYTGGTNGSWSQSVLDYLNPPAPHTETGTFTIPKTLARKEYIIQLAVLDPGGNVPSLRFAITNYKQGGYAPMGYIGIGRNPDKTAIDPSYFDDPTVDVSLRYYMPSERIPSRPIKLTKLTTTGSAIVLKSGGNTYDMRTLLLHGIDSSGATHVLDAANVAWKVKTGNSHAILSGSILTPSTKTGQGTVIGTLNGVRTKPITFEVSNKFGSISGSVSNSFGAALGGANITIKNKDTTYLTTSAADGTFSVEEVKAGSYTVTSSETGYTTTPGSDVKVDDGTTATVKIVMTLATGGNFSDDFSNGADKWTPGTGAWSVVDGAYIQTTIGGSNAWRYSSTITGKIWQSATYDVDLAYGGAGQNWGAFEFRKTHQTDTINNSGYLVDWNYTGKIELLRGGSATLVTLDTTQLSTDWTIPHHLKVENIGTSIKVYVDNETTPVLSADDSTYEFGYAGVGTDGAKWSFDNVKVTDQQGS
jgi:hypothetical protein